ncbi:MAG TPA: hypothetical protein DCY48_03475 [Candidatus Magasanikbacteria bacterium]|nr:MAG: hypothetical protein A3I74_04080 [Candidatus Magasanikbacteria bacterium RIFCSPLOWO2_02_FULL_47_16]OGH79339.1 MAG: hypothetical protein A3C10_04620 [Candidatus Magasanikbacteria bacterium RIFCSPHIGHO2_02_FULL_48_18]OGH83448.1 MAG: hypothetical protein A3G08_03435 [Candidatus Magasanikbacteria bacterium RIFCSPLOWO2_12_FULL_47_9b]HAZ28804.1 hypothetical protein [Candidatus Magasanikbacteria bacterium]
MTRQRFSLLLFFVFASIHFFYAIPSVFAGSGSALLYFSPVRDTAIVGHPFSISLWVKPGDVPVDTLTVHAFFLEDFLEISLVVFHESINDVDSNYEVNNEDGTFSLTATVGEPVRESMAFATITLLPKQKGGAVFSFQKSLTALSVGGQHMPFFTDDSYYTIRTEEQKSKDSDAPIIAKDSVSELIVGDRVLFIRNDISTSSLFRGDPPILRGTTNIPGATIRFSVDSGLLSANVRAGGEGTWEWELPDILLPGVYHVLMSATHPQYPTLQDIDLFDIEVVNNDVRETLFQIDVLASEDRVRGGSSLPFIVRLSDDASTLEEQSQTLLHLAYHVEDPSHGLLTEFEENVVLVGPQWEKSYNIDIPKKAERGTYTVYATIALNDVVVAGNATTFHVGLSAMVIVAIIALGLVFIGGIFFLVQKYTKR